MNWTLEVTGMNLEKCLSLAARSGIVIRHASRTPGRTLLVRVGHGQSRAFCALCAQYGWTVSVVRRGFLLRAAQGIRSRMSIPAAALLFFLLTWCSSRMLWDVEILHAGKAAGEVRAYLEEAQIRPGRFKAGLSLSSIREALMLRLPDLAFVGASWRGSALVIDCRPSLEGENARIDGEGRDLIAVQDGVITRIAVQSGTPQVEVGQAVRSGDVLVKGEERGEKGAVLPVRAQGDVHARVWARGDAKAALYAQRTVETGEYRRRVALCSPWGRRTVREAEPFDAQDSSVSVQPVVGLFLPVWREIETLARIEVIREARSEREAQALAHGAAAQAAKLMCPTGVEILDKWVDYSMIDNEFVCATVVLEYEHAIAGRTGEESSSP